MLWPGQYPGGIHSLVYQVNGRTDLLGPPFGQRPVSAVDTSIERCDPGVRVDEGAVHCLQHGRRDDPSPVHNDQYRVKIS